MNEKRRVLITGGTGLIGNAISDYFFKMGLEVLHLSRHMDLSAIYPKYRWNIYQKYVDTEALTNTDYIVHLAGENIGASRWTDKRKERLYNSRIKGTRLLVDTLNTGKYPSVKKVIFASATGYYGNRGEEKLNTESDPGDDFLAQLTFDWEIEMKQLKKIPYAIIRNGVVLSDEGGVQPKLTLPMQFGIGIIPGSGKQWVPYIPMDELTQIFYEQIRKDHITQTINAVNENPLRFKNFIRLLARQQNKKIIPIHIPAVFLKIALGEMSIVLLSSQNVQKN